MNGHITGDTVGEIQTISAQPGSPRPASTQRISSLSRRRPTTRTSYPFYFAREEHCKTWTAHRRSPDTTTTTTTGGHWATPCASPLLPRPRARARRGVGAFAPAPAAHVLASRQRCRLRTFLYAVFLTLSPGHSYPAVLRSAMFDSCQ